MTLAFGSHISVSFALRRYMQFTVSLFKLSNVRMGFLFLFQNHFYELIGWRVRVRLIDQNECSHSNYRKILDSSSRELEMRNSVWLWYEFLWFRAGRPSWWSGVSFKQATRSLPFQILCRHGYCAELMTLAWLVLWEETSVTLAGFLAWKVFQWLLVWPWLFLQEEICINLGGSVAWKQYQRLLVSPTGKREGMMCLDVRWIASGRATDLTWLCC